MFKKVVNVLKDMFNEQKFNERLKNKDGTYMTYSLWSEPF